MSGVIEVSAKSTKSGSEAVIEYDFGENLSEMVEKFTDNVVFTNARAQFKIVLQAAMRRRLELGQPCDDLADNWKPGVQMERIVDRAAAAKAHYMSLSEEERAAWLEDLRASMEG